MPLILLIKKVKERIKLVNKEKNIFLPFSPFLWEEKFDVRPKITIFISFYFLFIFLSFSAHPTKYPSTLRKKVFIVAIIFYFILFLFNKLILCVIFAFLATYYNPINHPQK